jgi:hypothetical protein
MKADGKQLSNFLSKDDYYRDPWLKPNIAGTQKVLDYSVEFGFIPENIKASDTADLSFIEEARRRIGE